MRVCDIDRETEVAFEVTITLKKVGTDGTGEGDGELIPLELGAAAAGALSNLDWAGLNGLVPPSMRKKDPVRSAGAKKAAATRQANAASTPPAFPQGEDPKPADHAPSTGMAARASHGSTSAPSVG